MKFLYFSIALILFSSFWYSCQKENTLFPKEAVNAIQENTAEDRGGPILSVCNRRTVTFLQLASFAYEYTEVVDGELERVYGLCHAQPYCPNASEVEIWPSSFGCTNYWPECEGIGFGNDPVTPAQQDCLISYYYNLAVAQAPLCSHGKRKVVLGLDFHLDAFVTGAICGYVKYGCCHLGDPN